MTIQHIGNNWYIGRKSEGDNREQIAINNAIYISIEDGILSHNNNGIWNTLTWSTRSDQLAASITIPITKSNIGTSYTYVYPAFYDNVPIGIDLKGFSKLGIVIFWNKNGGTGRHDILLVDKSDPPTILLTSEGLPSGLVNGVNKSYDYPIPTEFQDFRGEVYLAGKSTVGTDSPIIDGIFLYLIR
jgi:hypothetical protein